METFVRPRPEGCVVIELEKMDFIYKVHEYRYGSHPLSSVVRDVQLIPKGQKFDRYIVYKTPTGAIMHYLESETGVLPVPTAQFVMNGMSKPTVKRGSRTWELLEALNRAMRTLTGFNDKGRRVR